MHIKVKVSTDQNKEKIEKISEDRFECFVKEKPENNMANKRLIELLAQYFGITENKVRIVKGHHSPSKIFSIEI